jgi:proteic killer suppression protein
LGHPALVIRTFRNARTERLFKDLDVPAFRGIERQSRRKLLVLHNAKRLDDLKVPSGNRLEALKGD